MTNNFIETDGIVTQTSIDQSECERSCFPYFSPIETLQQYEIDTLRKYGLLNESNEICLLRQSHKAYLHRGLEYLSGSFVVLDSSRPWICYWILHALELLNDPPQELFQRCVDTLSRCQHPQGGYGGGPQQIGHVAPTYAAVLSLLTIGTKEAYESIDRKKLHRFFLSLKQPSGAFSAHDNGEVDIRVTYCVVSIAMLLDIFSEDLQVGVVEYALSCQTYEGGFAGEPQNEAHGGYTFCAVAVLAIMKSLHLADIPLLRYWITSRQMKCEGGYQGRTNKLVDGCYSFWQGAIPVILATYLEDSLHQGIAYCDREKLQKYILLCGQQSEGGLRDKPGKPRDHYHTCYCLSGLSLAQHGSNSAELHVYGSQDNLVEKTHPIYNISMRKYHQYLEYVEHSRAS